MAHTTPPKLDPIKHTVTVFSCPVCGLDIDGDFTVLVTLDVAAPALPEGSKRDVTDLHFTASHKITNLTLRHDCAQAAVGNRFDAVSVIAGVSGT